MYIYFNGNIEYLSPNAFKYASNISNTPNDTNTSSTTDNTTDKCSIQGGRCMNPNSCTGGMILNQLCPGENSNYKCCVQTENTDNNNNNKNNSDDNSILGTILTITVTLAVLMVVSVFVFYRYQRSKNDKKLPDFQ